MTVNLSQKNNVEENESLVSVGMPTFNRPDGLRRSLNYICNQTHNNLEIIISDNASPGEETLRVVEEFMARDNRIKYYRQTNNLGPVANFQFVLDAATGEYFMWMSDDDWRDSRFVEILLNEMKLDKNTVVVFCDIAVIDEHGNRRSDFYQTYYTYLEQLVSDNKSVRLVRFFLQDEGLGKANIIYGLLRRCAIKDVSLVSMVEHYGFYGLDNLVLFRLLGKGGLKLVKDMLYGCAAGNVKHYESGGSNHRQGKWQTIFKQVNYLFAYVQLSKGYFKFILALIFPVKIILFYWCVLKSRLV